MLTTSGPENRFSAEYQFSVPGPVLTNPPAPSMMQEMLQVSAAFAMSISNRSVIVSGEVTSSEPVPVFTIFASPTLRNVVYCPFRVKLPARWISPPMRL